MGWLVDSWEQELASVRMAGHAIAYARKGWPVFPVWWPSYAGVCACREGGDCPKPAKHPLIGEGFKGATTCIKQVEAWWKRYPNANIGIATGMASGITVLDIDSDHGGSDSFAILIKRYGRPEPTPVVLTGGGGRHIYWKWADGHRCRQAVRPGIDVRSDGGYVLAAPSLHASGVRYEWHKDGHPRSVLVREAPEWVGALLRGDSVGSPARASPLPSGPIEEGTRNRSLFQWACRWQRLAMPDEDLSNRVHEMNARMCRPPLDAREVEKIIGSALRYAKGA